VNNQVKNNEPDFFWESVMRLAFQVIPAVICAIPLGAWAGASLYSGAPRIDDPAPVAASIERAHKGSQIGRPFGTGADAPMVDVEVNGRLDVAITLRDRDGQVIYRADPVNHVTTMAKRGAGRKPTAPVAREPETKAPVQHEAMPDGCEGAFSPYAAPRMAHVIGRCIS
jgi:hypothetical protein